MSLSVPLPEGPSSDSEGLRRGARRAGDRCSTKPGPGEISPRKDASEPPIRGTIRLMADDPEKRGDLPNLELPSLLGFRRKKKERKPTDPAGPGEASEATEAVAPSAPEGPETASSQPGPTPVEGSVRRLPPTPPPTAPTAPTTPTAPVEETAPVQASAPPAEPAVEPIP